MISSGLQIVYTHDEVAFVQNLVYYVERAYRTPDYGMWERGSRYNDGTPEIHASSIGIAKSALEAINGCNMFGEKGASWSVIYVDIDAHNRNRSIFETMLPRESSSKVSDIRTKLKIFKNNALKVIKIFLLKSIYFLECRCGSITNDIFSCLCNTRGSTI